MALVAACGAADDAASHGRASGTAAGAAGARSGEGGHGADADDGGNAAAAAGNSPRGGSDGAIGGRAGEPAGASVGGAGDPGGSGERGSGRSGEGGLADGGDGGRSPSDDLERRIDEAIAAIRADTCFAQEDAAACDWADYVLGGSELDVARSTGEAVLVVDDFGAGFYPDLVRYRNRLLGLYRVSGDAVLLETPSVRLPRRLGDVLVSFAGPEFLPAKALARVGAAANEAYGKLNLVYYGHGGVVFSHLVDLVPEQPLVLLELAELLALPPSICAGIDDETLAVARAHFDAVALSLKLVMAERGVHFVNASFGSTLPDLAVDWQRTCGTDPPGAEQLRPLLHVYDPLYDVLFASSGVITAQAATNLGSPEDCPFDQASSKYPNRARVGFMSALDSGLDEAGRGVVMAKEQFPSVGDADVFVNWGCETAVPEAVCGDPHYEFVAEFGLGTATISLMSSSYVDPLALGRLSHLRYSRHGAEPMTDALIQTLREELTPALCGSGGEPCVYQDPIAHRQLELYRLGYE